MAKNLLIVRGWGGGGGGGPLLLCPGSDDPDKQTTCSCSFRRNNLRYLPKGNEDGRYRQSICLPVGLFWDEVECSTCILIHYKYRSIMADTADKAHEVSASRRIKPFASLNSNDVLLGRGTGTNQYIGNLKFRALVEERKGEYSYSGRHGAKARIAKDVLDYIKSEGGRFLQVSEDQEIVDRIVEDGTWYVVDDKIALEKCKQALRQEPTGAAGAGALSRVSVNSSFLLPPTAASAMPMAPSFNSIGLRGIFPETVSSDLRV